MIKRDNCFDFLRFLFAMIVVIGHLTCIAQIPQLQQFSFLFPTGLSVTGFFVISGFLIAQSYDYSTWKTYLIKRARRLLPAYVFVIVACTIGLSLVSTLTFKEYFTSIDTLKYLGANLCFLNFLHPSLPGVFEHPLINDNSVNPALWTLKIEVCFYLCVPIIIYILKRSKHPALWMASIYILAVIYQHGCYYIESTYQAPIWGILARQLPGFMQYFIVGISGYIYKDIFIRNKNLLLIPALLIFVIEYIFGYEILRPLAFGIIILWCAWSLKALNNFSKYGDISYGIYIYHGPILKLLLCTGSFAAMGAIGGSIVYIASVLSAGWLSWHLLEKHALKRK